MSQLIIIVIAIILSILVAASTLLYLGESGETAAKSQATKYIQEAAQIRGAILIARNDGVYLDTESNLSVLVPKYLAVIPQAGENWKTRENEVYKTGIDDKVCLAANRSVGFDYKSTDTNVRKADGGYIPYCSKDNLNPNTPCCDNSNSTATTTNTTTP